MTEKQFTDCLSDKLLIALIEAEYRLQNARPPERQNWTRWEQYNEILEQRENSSETEEAEK